MFPVNLLEVLLGNGCFTDLDPLAHYTPGSSTADMIYQQIAFELQQSYYLVSLRASFGWARHAVKPLHSLFDVWLRDTKQRSGFTADPADRLVCWLTRAWVGDISCPSLIKLPCVAVFESDTGKLAKDQGHSRLTLLWCGRGRSLLLLGLVSWGQGQGWGGCLEHPGCQVVTHSHVATSG